jgi:predicted O-methyltransferase YrrM
MSRRSLNLTDALEDYLQEVSLREPPVFARLREETARMPRAGMQIAPEQGQFMGLLAELVGARLCLEIGTFTGYSALWLAQALPADGHLICCDVNPETSAVAERYWQEAGLASRIELRLGPALETLAALQREYAPGSFDLAFIDADKAPYEQYYEGALGLVRSGGLVLLDNVLWSGRVLDRAREDADTVALRSLNLKLRDDPHHAQPAAARRRPDDRPQAVEIDSLRTPRRRACRSPGRRA